MLYKLNQTKNHMHNEKYTNVCIQIFYGGHAIMLYWWNKIWDDNTSWMKIYANFASSRLNQLSMLSGDAHSSHKFGAQFLHFRSGRHEHFHPSRKCSFIHTKNRKIRSCWPQLCGLFGIAETKSVHLPRTICYRRCHQQRFKRWLTSNGPTPLMLCNLEALVNLGFDGLHRGRVKLK